MTSGARESSDQVPDTTPVRILLVDDHTMLREGLRRSLTAEGFTIVAEAADGKQAIELVAEHLPDVVLMDVTMPVLDGIEAARRIHGALPQIRVLMLTMHADPQLARQSVEAGAYGYLVKDCTTTELVEAVQRVMRGETTFPEASLRALGKDANLLTQREIEVLQLIANGASTAETAQTLYVSVKTVKNHLTSVYAKLATHDRMQAVLQAARMGIIRLPD